MYRNKKNVILEDAMQHYPRETQFNITGEVNLNEHAEYIEATIAERPGETEENQPEELEDSSSCDGNEKLSRFILGK